MLLYIRGGTIFARKDIARRSSSAMKYDPFTIVLALNSDNTAEGSLYVDDGDSFDYIEKLAFARIQFFATYSEELRVLKFKFDVSGNTALLQENLLQANKAVLITGSGFTELPIELNLKQSQYHEFKL